MFSDLDDVIQSEIDFQFPNTTINIFKGEITLKNGNVNHSTSGDIDFEWYPLQRAVIRCTFQNSVNNVDAFCQHEVFIKGQKIGILEPRSCILGRRFTLIGDILELELGETSIPTNAVKFSVLNLKPIETELKVVQRNVNDKILSKRLSFETAHFNIKIDKRINFDEHWNSLRRTGGFHILWFGEIVAKRNYQISYSEIKKIRKPIKFFLSFLAGNYVHPMFFKGKYDGETKWEEYRGHKVKPYTESFSWVKNLSKSQIQLLWNEYYILLQEESSRALIFKTISWYLEINHNIGNTESQIITAQANLELIYNWLIVDRKQLLKGNDTTSISASNKIRLLLNELNLTTELHPSLSELGLLKSKHQILIDAPEIIVFIRNSIVHGQMEKQKFLQSLSKGALRETLSILRWYTEISILNILKFKGVINNRFGEPYIDLGYEIK